MKKLLLSLVALMAISMTANAQYAKLYKGETLVNQYSKDVVDKVEFSQTSANILNGHEYVEIGGKKWATMNLGATTVASSYSTCYGNYYAWGSTDPYLSKYTLSYASTMSSTQWKGNGGYTQANAPYYDGSSYTKYTSSSDATLESIDDAATAAWGGTWRMPTKDDFVALRNACTGGSGEDGSTPTTLSAAVSTGGVYWLSADQTYESAYTGVAGLLFVDNSDTSKRVFFPAAGLVDGTSFDTGGSRGYYWSSSLYTSIPYYAYFLAF